VSSPPPTDERRLPFLGHLLELRNRIFYSVAFLVVAIFTCYFFAEDIFDFVAEPLVKVMRQSPELHIQSPMDVFFVYVELAAVAGIVLASPLVFWQLWAFVSPGLYRNEKRLTLGFVISATLCFVGGMAFAYYVVFPFGFDYLLGFAYDRKGNFSLLEQLARVYDLQVDYGAARFVRAAVRPTIMMDRYVDLMLKLLFAFGLIFEMPLVMYFLARTGLVTHRGLIRFFRYWIVLAFIIGAVLTPPDVMSQLMMSIPLVLMYCLGILFAWYFTRKRERLEREALGYRDR
jgi:sec-independent protein translocase protein TatC